MRFTFRCGGQSELTPGARERSNSKWPPEILKNCDFVGDGFETNRIQENAFPLRSRYKMCKKNTINMYLIGSMCPKMFFYNALLSVIINYDVLFYFL